MITRRQFAPMLAAPLLAQQRKPNIVFIVSDDHHWQALGAAGNPNIKTQHLDKLASRGVLFTNGIISTSQCAPSRGILLSGLESYQTGLDCNDHIKFRTFSGATVVEQLRRGGYATNLVGKWHITNSPKDCGFTSAPLWMQAAATQYEGAALRHGLDATEDKPTPGLTTHVFTAAAEKVIREAKSPYLLWLTYNAPHTPWTASEQYLAMYRGRNATLAPPAHPKPVPVAGGGGAGAAKKGGTKKGGPGGGRADGMFDWETYYAVISELDANIGKVVEAVESAGQWDNTLILFIGDNGYLAGSKGLQGKVRAWEQSIRIPFLASGGLVKRSFRSDAPVASIDVPATMLEVAGIRSSHKMAGASFRGVLNGGKFGREVAFSCWNDGRPEALLVPQPVEPYRVVRTPAHKYILWESKKEALFDLKADPFEEKNLAGDAAQSGLLKKMRDRVRARMKETSDAAIAWIPA